MKAVVEINKKQFLVDEGKEIYVDLMEEKKEGEVLTFDKVLVCDDKIGTPYIEGCKVTARIIKHGKEKKINVLQHIPKKHHKTRYGHRQGYTKLLIESIK